MISDAHYRRYDDHLVSKLRFRISRALSYILFHNHRFPYALYLRKKLCKRLVPSADGPTVCPHFFGIDLLVDPKEGKGLEEIIYYLGIYEAGTISVLKRVLKQGDIFFDVGANIGSISCVASCFVGTTGQVHAFEPHPRIYKLLEYNRRINQIWNLFPHNVAVGGKLDQLKIYDRTEINRGAATLIHPGGSVNESYEVDVMPIDWLIENRKLPRPTLIKIDVEGFELEVLKGAEKLLASSQAPMLCVEYSTYLPQHGGETRDIFRFVQAVNNYSIYKPKFNKEVPCDLARILKESDLPRHDNIFCFLDKHIEELEYRTSLFG